MFNLEDKKKSFEPTWKKSIELQRQENDLRKIATTNLRKSALTQRKSRPDLVDNFHWIIMRVRRQKKLTQEQFAKEISEPLDAVMLAEQGILPETDYVLVRKIERALGVSLVKAEHAKEELAKKRQLEMEREATLPKVLKIEPKVVKELTIADLRKIKEKRDSGIIGDDGEDDESESKEQKSEENQAESKS